MDKLTEYVILIAFPLQQWLLERVPMLRYTYTACLVLRSAIDGWTLLPNTVQSVINLWYSCRMKSAGEWPVPPLRILEIPGWYLKILKCAIPVVCIN